MNKFGKQPVHFFGRWGSIMFLIGLMAVCVVGILKWVALANGTPAPLVTNLPYFYIALTMMIIGTQLFMSGFIAELVTRNAPERNNYQISEEI